MTRVVMTDEEGYICEYCNTVHDSTDQLRECAMCDEPNWASQMSPCQRISCNGKPASRNRARPQSRQRQEQA